MSAKVSLTGASGHVGANLVRELLDQGREVRVLVRDDIRALKGLDVEIVKGDIMDKESLRKLFKGSETVFHAAAKISIIGSENGLVEKTNIEGVKNVVNTCLECGVKRLVHFSSIHAYESNPDGKVIDENRELALSKKHFAYDRSKAAGQLEIFKGVEKGLDAVIVSPTAVLGPNDFKVSRMGSVILDIYHKRIPALVNGGYNWVDARDIVSGALAAEKKGRIGESYLLTGRWAPMKELASLITHFSGKKTPSVATPLWMAKVAAPFSLAYGLATKQEPKFTPVAVKSVKMHRFISHLKATKELGYNPRPLEETMKDTLEWFGNAGMLAN